MVSKDRRFQFPADTVCQVALGPRYSVPQDRKTHPTWDVQVRPVRERTCSPIPLVQTAPSPVLDLLDLPRPYVRISHERNASTFTPDADASRSGRFTMGDDSAMTSCASALGAQPSAAQQERPPLASPLGPPQPLRTQFIPLTASLNLCPPPGSREAPSPRLPAVQAPSRTREASPPRVSAPPAIASARHPSSPEPSGEPHPPPHVAFRTLPRAASPSASRSPDRPEAFVAATPPASGASAAPPNAATSRAEASGTRRGVAVSPAGPSGTRPRAARSRSEHSHPHLSFTSPQNSHASRNEDSPPASLLPRADGRRWEW